MSCFKESEHQGNKKIGHTFSCSNAALHQLSYIGRCISQISFRIVPKDKDSKDGCYPKEIIRDVH